MTLDNLWDYYREFCETAGNTYNSSGDIKSAVAFLCWLNKKIKK